MFKEPIEILPNTNYTASATLKASKRLPALVQRILNLKLLRCIPGPGLPLRHEGDEESLGGFGHRREGHLPVLLRRRK